MLAEIATLIEQLKTLSQKFRTVKMLDLVITEDHNLFVEFAKSQEELNELFEEAILKALPQEHAVGTLTANGTEQTVSELTELGIFEGHIDLSNMQNGDSITIREYVKIKEDGDYKLYESATYSDAQEKPALHIIKLPNKYGIKITLEQTSGTYRDFDFNFFKRGYLSERDVEDSIMTDGTEQTIVELTELGTLEGYIDLSNMESGDAITIKEYVKIKEGGDYKLYESATYSGLQEKPILHIVKLPAKYGVKITLQQTSGIYKTFNYLFFEEVIPPNA